jgi:hypothetical protein
MIHGGIPMKRGATIVVQIVIILLGIGVLAALIWEPQVEGRNVNATQFEIYFKDPFLAYIYLAFVPFFVGLYHAFNIAGDAGRDELFSPHVARRLRIIKLCAFAMVIFFIGALAYIIIFVRGKDDIAGGVAMGLMIIIASGVTAVVAAVFERMLRNSTG